jgi:hypothetical protein
MLISSVFAIFFIMAFIADGLPLIIAMQQMSILAKASLKTIGTDKMTDSEKQKLLLINSANIFKQSLKIAALVAIVLTLGYLLIFAGGFFKLVNDKAFFSFLGSTGGIIISMLGFLFYFLIKKLYARARL